MAVNPKDKSSGETYYSLFGVDPETVEGGPGTSRYLTFPRRRGQEPVSLLDLSRFLAFSPGGGGAIARPRTSKAVGGQGAVLKKTGQLPRADDPPKKQSNTTEMPPIGQSVEDVEDSIWDYRDPREVPNFFPPPTNFIHTTDASGAIPQTFAQKMMLTEPSGETVPSGVDNRFNSNAGAKFDKGVPAPFSQDWASQGWHGMWNAFDQMLRGTVFGQGAPGGVSVQPKSVGVPLPEPNPMFHMMPGGAEQMITEALQFPVMNDPIEAAPQPARETPSKRDLEPPLPERRSAPKRVEKKENTQAKRKSSPPTPTRNPRRA